MPHVLVFPEIFEPIRSHFGVSHRVHDVSVTHVVLERSSVMPVVCELVKRKKPAVTREQVYAFARGSIERDCPEAAAAAVICLEWLQRPENVLAGYLAWTDDRSKDWPNA